MQVESYDQEKDIDFLLQKHAAEISKLQKKTADVCTDRTVYDEIFYLRYILSNGTAEKSEEGVRFAVQYRNDPVNKFWLDKVKNERDQGFPHNKELQEMGLSPTSMHKTCFDGSPIQLVRQGAVDAAPLLDMWTDEEMLRYNNLMKEEAFLICDEVTRRTRKLVKLIFINDFRCMPMQRPPKKWMNAFGESSKIGEKVYPQLIGATVMINTPTWMNWMLKIVKVFLSKRLIEKFRNCPGDTESGSIAECPYIKKTVPIDNIPSYLGGKCNCAGGCVKGINNSIVTETRKVTEEEVELAKSIIERQREKHAAELKAYLDGLGKK